MSAPFPAMTDRAALPEPLRLLLDDYPREGWAAHPAFGGLVQFWLERHMNFRRLTALLTEDAQALLDGRIAPDAYAPRLGRLGQTFLQELHGHHTIEDQHYFPQLAAAEPRLEAGFEMLERDHQALDPALARFAEQANLVLGKTLGPEEARDAAGAREGAAGVLREVGSLTQLLDRHLTDEEELVVPVVLKSGLG